MTSSSVVIYDLYVPSFASAPYKTNPPLIIDPDAMLSSPVPFQGLQTIAYRNAQIVQMLGRVNRAQFCPGSRLNLMSQASDLKPGKNRGRDLVGKAFDHR
jgi:hypothetical protein